MRTKNTSSGFNIKVQHGAIDAFFRLALVRYTIEQMIHFEIIFITICIHLLAILLIALLPHLSFLSPSPITSTIVSISSQSFLVILTLIDIQVYWRASRVTSNTLMFRISIYMTIAFTYIVYPLMIWAYMNKPWTWDHIIAIVSGGLLVLFAMLFRTPLPCGFALASLHRMTEPVIFLSMLLQAPLHSVVAALHGHYNVLIVHVIEAALLAVVGMMAVYYRPYWNRQISILLSAGYIFAGLFKLLVTLFPISSIASLNLLGLVFFNILYVIVRGFIRNQDQHQIFSPLTSPWHKYIGMVYMEEALSRHAMKSFTQSLAGTSLNVHLFLIGLMESAPTHLPPGESLSLHSRMMAQFKDQEYKQPSLARLILLLQLSKRFPSLRELRNLLHKVQTDPQNHLLATFDRYHFTKLFENKLNALYKGRALVEEGDRTPFTHLYSALDYSNGPSNHLDVLSPLRNYSLFQEAANLMTKEVNTKCQIFDSMLSLNTVEVGALYKYNSQTMECSSEIITIADELNFPKKSHASYLYPIFIYYFSLIRNSIRRADAIFQAYKKKLKAIAHETNQYNHISKDYLVTSSGSVVVQIALNRENLGEFLYGTPNANAFLGVSNDGSIEGQQLNNMFPPSIGKNHQKLMGSYSKYEKLKDHKEEVFITGFDGFLRRVHVTVRVTPTIQPDISSVCLLWFPQNSLYSLVLVDRGMNVLGTERPFWETMNKAQPNSIIGNLDQLSYTLSTSISIYRRFKKIYKGEQIGKKKTEESDLKYELMSSLIEFDNMNKTLGIRYKIDKTSMLYNSLGRGSIISKFSCSNTIGIELIYIQMRIESRSARVYGEINNLDSGYMSGAVPEQPGAPSPMVHSNPNNFSFSTSNSLAMNSSSKKNPSFNVLKQGDTSELFGQKSFDDIFYTAIQLIQRYFEQRELADRTPVNAVRMKRENTIEPELMTIVRDLRKFKVKICTIDSTYFRSEKGLTQMNINSNRDVGSNQLDNIPPSQELHSQKQLVPAASQLLSSSFSTPVAFSPAQNQPQVPTVPAFFIPPTHTEAKDKESVVILKMNDGQDNKDNGKDNSAKKSGKIGIDIQDIISLKDGQKKPDFRLNQSRRRSKVRKESLIEFVGDAYNNYQRKGSSSILEGSCEEGEDHKYACKRINVKAMIEQTNKRIAKQEELQAKDTTYITTHSKIIKMLFKVMRRDLSHKGPEGESEGSMISSVSRVRSSYVFLRRYENSMRANHFTQAFVLYMIIYLIGLTSIIGILIRISLNMQQFVLENSGLFNISHSTVKLDSYFRQDLNFITEEVALVYNLALPEVLGPSLPPAYYNTLLSTATTADLNLKNTLGTDNFIETILVRKRKVRADWEFALRYHNMKYSNSELNGDKIRSILEHTMINQQGVIPYSYLADFMRAYTIKQQQSFEFLELFGSAIRGKIPPYGLNSQIKSQFSRYSSAVTGLVNQSLRGIMTKNIEAIRYFSELLTKQLTKEFWTKFWLLWGIGGGIALAFFLMTGFSIYRVNSNLRSVIGIYEHLRREEHVLHREMLSRNLQRLANSRLHELDLADAYINLAQSRALTTTTTSPQKTKTRVTRSARVIYSNVFRSARVMILVNSLLALIVIAILGVFILLAQQLQHSNEIQNIYYRNFANFAKLSTNYLAYNCLLIYGNRFKMDGVFPEDYKSENSAKNFAQEWLGKRSELERYLPKDMIDLMYSNVCAFIKDEDPAANIYRKICEEEISTKSGVVAIILAEGEEISQKRREVISMYQPWLQATRIGGALGPNIAYYFQPKTIRMRRIHEFSMNLFVSSLFNATESSLEYRFTTVTSSIALLLSLGSSLFVLIILANCLGVYRIVERDTRVGKETFHVILPEIITQNGAMLHSFEKYFRLK